MAAKKKAAAKKDVLVVGSKVKAYIKSKKLMCAGDTIEGLSNKVYEMIDQAAGRTKNNKRSTLRPHDL